MSFYVPVLGKDSSGDKLTLNYFSSNTSVLIYNNGRFDVFPALVDTTVTVRIVAHDSTGEDTEYSVNLSINGVSSGSDSDPSLPPVSASEGTLESIAAQLDVMEEIMRGAKVNDVQHKQATQNLNTSVSDLSQNVNTKLDSVNSSLKNLSDSLDSLNQSLNKIYILGVLFSAVSLAIFIGFLIHNFIGYFW